MRLTSLPIDSGRPKRAKRGRKARKERKERRARRSTLRYWTLNPTRLDWKLIELFMK